MSIATKFRRLVNLYKLAWAGDRIDLLEAELNRLRGQTAVLNTQVHALTDRTTSQIQTLTNQTNSQVQVLTKQDQDLNQRHEDLTRMFLTYAVASGTKRLIVFLTPGYEARCGGVLSINAIYEESVALRDLHQAEVALCTIPGDPPLLKYTWFDNRNYLLDLESVLRESRNLEYLLIHIPELVVNRVADWLTTIPPTLLQRVGEVHFNVMIQNIDLMEEQDISGLMPFGKVTCTTAHDAYTNSTTREALGVPLHRWLVCNGPERYSVSSYQQKESILVVSHDPHPMKERVLQEIARAHPDVAINVVENLSYEDYLSLARRAKWSLTFGEGLDGYFVEPVYSGGIGFAVFNPRFFTPAFENLDNVYSSWEDLLDNIASDMQRLDEPVAFTQCWQQTYDLLGELYSTDRFRQNLRQFYRGDYTFP